MTGALLLAVEDSEVSAGPIGLLILLLMLIATWLLIRNMNARLKRLPREFPDRSDPADRGPAARD